ncbi:MAG: indole-3-glycerol phosphate synthase TrpC [Candidatus Margulisiibacteriota bacterium]|jgi:indole-3-glycerol phosphate synthase
MHILDKIIQTKKQEIANIFLVEPVAVKPTRDFFGALKQPPAPRIIAEVKKASPSKGLIYNDFDPVRLALQFEAQGAAAISVLTDEQYFQGKLAYLTAVKEAVKIPVLRKDFIISEKQIKEAAVAGADAVLLIVKVLLRLSDNRPDRALLLLSHFMGVAEDHGLHCLVEVHDALDLKIAVTSGNKIIGINNRNLDTFTLDLETTATLSALVPESWRSNNCLVSESGMFSKSDFPAGVDAVLVGEGLARDPGAFF